MVRENIWTSHLWCRWSTVCACKEPAGEVRVIWFSKAHCWDGVYSIVCYKGISDLITLQAFSKMKSNKNTGSFFRSLWMARTLLSTKAIIHRHTQSFKGSHSHTKQWNAQENTARYQQADWYAKRETSDNQLCSSQNNVKRLNINDYIATKFTRGQLIPCSTFKLAHYLGRHFF